MHSRYVSGFTLIEVLVAVFVLAVGVMGALAAQTVALRTRHESALMSHGVQLATSFADRMRANSAQMRVPDAVNPYLRIDYDAASDGAPDAPAQPCQYRAPCDSAAMASFDTYELQRELHAAFPAPRLLVCRDAVMWSEAEDSLSWDCTGGAADPVVIKLGWRLRPSGEGAEAAHVPIVAILVSGDPA
ncbi:type IV pilus modification protein PilV [Massilia soli]|uniref:Type IV pilus modification protein PilV n=1 Tax=Massilia soli TaxID=2792854 RepID=A0ABS7SLA3_9BURK|nr:type IV pilus modification protein PilV [Massilia soli]